MAESGVKMYYNKETVTFTEPPPAAPVQYSDGLVTVSVG